MALKQRLNVLSAHTVYVKSPSNPMGVSAKPKPSTRFPSTPTAAISKAESCAAESPKLSFAPSGPIHRRGTPSFLALRSRDTFPGRYPGLEHHRCQSPWPPSLSDVGLAEFPLLGSAVGGLPGLGGMGGCLSIFRARYWLTTLGLVLLNTLQISAATSIVTLMAVSTPDTSERSDWPLSRLSGYRVTNSLKYLFFFATDNERSIPAYWGLILTTDLRM